MAITPPENRLWWNEPIERIEIGWIVVAFLWGLFMFFFMIAWHFIGGQNLSTETYRITPSVYEEKVIAFADKYQAGEEAGVPDVVVVERVVVGPGHERAMVVAASAGSGAGVTVAGAGRSGWRTRCTSATTPIAAVTTIETSAGAR